LLFLVEDREKEDGAGEESGLGETCDIRYVPLEAGQSGSPSTTRHTARPAKECTAPVQALTIPHATHIPQMSVGQHKAYSGYIGLTDARYRNLGSDHVGRDLESDITGK